MLVVYVVEGCGFCKEVIEKLEEDGINHLKLSADDSENESTCVMLENFFLSKRYPKLVLDYPATSNENHSHYSIFFNPDEGSRPVGDMPPGIKAEYYVSVEHLIIMLKPYLK